MTKNEYINETESLNAQIIERTATAAKIEMIFGSNDEIAKKYWVEVESLKQQKQQAQAMSGLHHKTRSKIEKDFAGL